MENDKLVEYWLDSSKKDYRVMRTLFKNGHYVWALFLGHLVLEKLIKAIFVKRKGAEAPFSHDLTRIADRAGILMTEEQKDLLDEITTFNIEARYPDYNSTMRKVATKPFATRKISEIAEMRKWLLQNLTDQ